MQTVGWAVLLQTVGLVVTMLVSHCRKLLFSLLAGDTVEEQRALATLGRTYLMQSEGEGEGEESDKEVLLKAGNAFLKSLDVCDKIVNIVPERWEK